MVGWLSGKHALRALCQAAVGAPTQLAPAVMQQLMKELKDLAAKPAEGITVFLNEDNIADVQAEVEGPGARRPLHPLVPCCQRRALSTARASPRRLSQRARRSKGACFA